jgi:hypothetical protein
MLGIGSGSFDPETLVILETAFDEAWITLKSNGSANIRPDELAWEWPASPTCPPSGLGSTRCSDFLRRLVSDSVETTCREADLI